MKSNTLLIYPPATQDKQPLFGLPPLGILYISSYLNKKKIKTLVLDSEIESFSYNDIKSIIIENNIGVIGFSVMTVFLNTALHISTRLKNDFSDIYIVLGGPHISGTKEETLKINKNIDFLIYGEGEVALYSLIDSLRNNKPLSNVSNLIYRKDNAIIINEPQHFVNDLDSLPFPELDHIINFKPGLYNVPYSLNRTSSIITSRGCPYNCNFCSAYITHGHKWRNRSIDNVVEEIKYNYDKYGIRYFVIKDSLFSKDKEWTHKFCNGILSSRIKVNFRCNTRIDCVDKSLLKRMKECGFDIINFGIESGDDNILNTINKQLNKDLALKVFDIANKLEIKTHATFMIGNIGETKESLNNTITYAKEINPFFARFFPATAYPGTQLYNYSVKNNLVEDKWYLSDLYKNTVNERYLFPEFNKGTLLFKDFHPNKEARNAFWSFYLRPKIIFRLIIMMLTNKKYFINILKAGTSLIRYKLLK